MPSKRHKIHRKVSNLVIKRNYYNCPNYVMYSQELNYRKHCVRLTKAHSVVDAGPPRMMPASFMNIKKMKSDHYALRRIMRQNTMMLMRINKIERTRGFTVNRRLHHGIVPSNHRVSCFRLEIIEEENIRLGNRILAVKGVLNTRDSKMRHSKSLVPLKYRLPENFMNLYMGMMPELDRYTLGTLARPRVYFDLEVYNVRPVGRIVIQLFMEACPELVMEFVRAVGANPQENIQLIRIFPGLWLESEIRVNSPVLASNTFPCCSGVIDHEATGVLSFANRFAEDGFPYGLINYTISFKPLHVANKSRIPFGVVTKGMPVVECLQDYGTKNGITKKRIVVSAAGIIH